VAQSLFPEPIVIPRKTAHFLSAAHNALPTLLREREQLLGALRAIRESGCWSSAIAGDSDEGCPICTKAEAAIAAAES
jgi:hypothetical protein